MVHHLVLVRWRDGADPAAIQATIKALCRLESEIPEVVSAEATEDFGADSFSHGVVFKFESRDALDRYVAHPAHARVVAEQLRPLMDGIQAVDLETISADASA